MLGCEFRYAFLAGCRPTNVVWERVWISPSSVLTEDFTLSSRTSRQLLLVAARSGSPAGESLANQHFAVCGRRKSPVSVAVRSMCVWSLRKATRLCPMESLWSARLGFNTKPLSVRDLRVPTTTSARFAAGTLRKSIMLTSSTRLEMGVEKGHSDEVLPGSSRIAFWC